MTLRGAIAKLGSAINYIWAKPNLQRIVNQTDAEFNADFEAYKLLRGCQRACKRELKFGERIAA